MSKINTKTKAPRAETHEGGPAARPGTALAQLRRSVLSCLLWEDQFYEDGVAIADRIKALAAQVDPIDLAALAVEARSSFNLRHVPLLLLIALLDHRKPAAFVGEAIGRVIQRADEPGELLAMWWKSDKDRPLAKQLKVGLAAALRKFDAYQLAKYDREAAVKLRDVLFLTHAKPRDDAQAALWKQLVDGTLPTPDTWEVALSSGADKRETFERLIREDRLGYLALLRNLRNMANAGVDPALVKDAITGGNARRVLPFRFVAAARAAPQFEPALDLKLRAVIADQEPLPGRTTILVDVSGSMDERLSAKSDMTRMDAACTLAAMWPGACRVFSFSNAVVEVPPRKGMAGVDAIRSSQSHGGTHLGGALSHVNAKAPYDRIIVITDEQSHDAVGAPLKGARGYMVNVASYQNGVGYGAWTRINGFSEQVLRYIAAAEREGLS